MKITDVTLSILRTELEETVIPTHGAVDAMPPLVLVSVSTAEGIDGNYISDASVAATAEALVCHPNTVRYRLRRIEKRTGRSRSRPRDVAELCLVFEAQAASHVTANSPR